MRNMTRGLAFAGVLAFVMFVVTVHAETPAAVQTAAKQAGPIDPVSGKKVKAADAPLAIFLDTVYKFQSAANLAKFRAAPERYATTHCPVSDEEVRIKDAPAKTQYGGRTWYFCCSDCKAKFEEHPANYVTYRCPSCGGVALVSMEGSVTAAYDGREMRFCCTHCQEKFDVNPAAYFALVVPEGGISEAPGGSAGQK
jgi:YHS domain-containing protein